MDRSWAAKMKYKVTAAKMTKEGRRTTGSMASFLLFLAAVVITIPASPITAMVNAGSVNCSPTKMMQMTTNGKVNAVKAVLGLFKKVTTNTSCGSVHKKKKPITGIKAAERNKLKINSNFKKEPLENRKYNFAKEKPVLKKIVRLRLVLKS
jgi:hypothetical protein